MSLGSNVSPRIFGSLTVGRVSLSMCSVRVVLYSAGSGVNSVVVVLDLFSVRLLSFIHVFTCSRYGCICCCAVFGFMYDDMMVVSSAYVTLFTVCGGVGMSDVYMLNNVGESTPPCGTPDFVILCFDVLLLNIAYCLRPFM